MVEHNSFEYCLGTLCILNNKNNNINVCLLRVVFEWRIRERIFVGFVNHNSFWKIVTLFLYDFFLYIIYLLLLLLYQRILRRQYKTKKKKFNSHRAKKKHILYYNKIFRYYKFISCYLFNLSHNIFF